MSYLKFFIKRLIKDKLNLLMIFICLGATFITLSLNLKVQPSVSVQNNLKNDIKFRKRNIESKNPETDLLTEKELLKEDKRALGAYQNKKFNMLYEILLKQNTDLINSFGPKDGRDKSDKGPITSAERDKIRYEA